jgi:hypothetical protein
MPEKDCADCGVPLGDVHHNKRYCSDCRQLRRLVAAREATARYREGNPPQKAPVAAERICRNCRQVISLKKNAEVCYDCRALRKELSNINFRLKNPDYAKASRDRNRESIRESKYKTQYGISLADYDRMLSEQRGVCRICGVHPRHGRNNGRGNLAVDHCHKTGKVRGLLCGRCNTGLGLYEDEPDFLKSAIHYLESSI